MSILNQIAAFGQNAGQGAITGVNMAHRRQEANRNYELSKQRYDAQDKRYSNEMARYDQEQAQKSAQAERDYAQTGVKAIYSTPPEYRQQAYQGWLQGAQKRGYDVNGVPPEYSDEVLYKLAGSVGADLRPDKNSTPANIQEWDTFSKMPPADQERYLGMKRASQVKDFGGYVGGISPVDGSVTNLGNKTIPPQDQPSFKYAQKRQEMLGGMSGRIETEPTLTKANEEAKNDAAAVGLKNATDTKNSKSLATYETGMGALSSALENASTGPVAGRIPAWSSEDQIADGAFSSMAPIMKDLFRGAGEGVFTDSDQRLLTDMLPKRSDRPEAAKAKMATIDAIVRAKLTGKQYSLMTDADGNQAWVGPNGEIIEAR